MILIRCRYTEVACIYYHQCIEVKTASTDVNMHLISEVRTWLVNINIIC